MLYREYDPDVLKKLQKAEIEILKDFEPNILLTDVRMPRLNGIDLAFKTRELYPNCMILFMSGYSDKEYLKSAIKLKAINYVEKPIEIE